MVTEVPGATGLVGASVMLPPAPAAAVTVYVGPGVWSSSKAAETVTSLLPMVNVAGLAFQRTQWLLLLSSC